MHETHVSLLRSRFENSTLVMRLSEANREAAEANRQMAARILEQKRIEDALQRSTARSEALIEASPLAIIVQDERGVVKRWNRAAERIFGWREEEVLDKMSPLVAAHMQEQTERFNEIVLGGQQFDFVEAVRQRKDGALSSTSISAAPLRDTAGMPNGLVVIMADISERKKNERLRQLEHTITRLLSESRTVEDAMPQVLGTIGELAGCSYGARWVLIEDQLRCLDVWHIDDARAAHFADLGLKRGAGPEMRKGGLLGTVWSTGVPHWIEDVIQDRTLDRAELAAQSGLRSAFAFPIMVAGKFYGVLEFFGPQVRRREEALVHIFTAVGSQIGQFIARKEAESRLTFFANHDALTGLPNRAMFNQQLVQALARAQRHHKIAAVLFVDLDRFKVINDTLGREAGDRLLKQLAVKLRESLCEGDTVGRQGGDEFVVLVEELTQPGQVSGVAHKILEAIAKPYVLPGQEVHVTGSIGISIYPDDGADAQTLLKNADIAMYRAKEQGRNNFQF
jgi:diguanylate cyclase (GGDEF)-like protein/PAS domain S-box-containing protein